MFEVRFNREEIYANNEVFATEQEAKTYALEMGQRDVGTNYQDYVEECEELGEEIETFEEWFFGTTWFVEIIKHKL